VPESASMRRVLILGCSGAGKSTLARRMGKLIGLPVIHLDQMYWQPGWVEPKKTEWHAALAKALEGETWIMDGNFTSTIAKRAEFADTVIFFDFPTWICVGRVLKRVWTTLGTVRADMAPGCPERFNWEFIQYILRFRKKYRPKVTGGLEKFTGELIVFKRPRDAERYLRGLEDARGGELDTAGAA